MENPRWWHIAITVMSIVVVAVALTSADANATRRLGAIASVAVFAAGWFLVGRHSWRVPAAAIAFSIIVIVTTGAAVSFYPLMAILQCVAYPVLWVISPGLRAAILANLGLATAVAIGFMISTGDVLQTVATTALSLGFSLALGLWISRIADLSEERRALLAELQAAQEELADAHRTAGVTSERERLAREIHDTIAQDLTGIVMLTQRARREHDSETLGLLETSARDVLAETRALVEGRTPAAIESGGLIDALHRLAERVSRETHMTVVVEADAVPTLPRDTEVVLLRIAQEGLANVRKHAAAENAVVELSVDGEGASLVVRDDGRGFDATAPRVGFGLDGMRERLALVGGALDIESGASGTILTATLPPAVTR